MVVQLTVLPSHPWWCVLLWCWCSVVVVQLTVLHFALKCQTRLRRHQEQAPKQRYTFSPTTFSSVNYVQFSSVGVQFGVLRSVLTDYPLSTGLSLTTPFTEGCPGVNNKASPPGRHQEQAPKQRCTFSTTTFSSVQS